MKLFTQNAAALLFERVNSLRHRHDSWRCIQLKLSGARHSHTLRTHFILRSVTDILEDEEVYVYLCHDNDIFILFQGRAQGILNKLASCFADIDPDYASEKSSALFKLYDLHKDWAFFFAICYRKSTQKDDDWYQGDIGRSMESCPTSVA